MKQSGGQSLQWYSPSTPIPPEFSDFLPYWDFIQKDGNPYRTLDPYNIPPEWLNREEPASIFDIPEVWYGVQRCRQPALDRWIWQEAEFCSLLWEKYSSFPMEYLLEACCGICPHGSIWAKKGTSIVGVDSSSGMVKAVEARAEAQNLNITAYKRDVFQFSIPGTSPDGAVLLSSTFPIPYHNRTDNTALINQLRSVGFYIKRGGLFIIDCGYPDPPRIVTDEILSETQNYDLGFAKVSVRTLTFPTRIDTWETPSTMYYTVEYPGGTVRLIQQSSRSFISAAHLQALVEMSRIFTLEAFHHWGNLDPGLRPNGGAYTAVLKRI